MVERAPHGTPVYRIDNQSVWNLLWSWLEDDPASIHIRPAQVERDGRKAWLLLQQHYKGKNAANSLSISALNKLSTMVYSGNSRRWSFDKFTAEHKAQHQILESLELAGDSKGIDESAKVRYLLQGIKDPKLAVIKAQVLSQAELINSFEDAVRLFNDFLNLSGPASAPGTAQYNVSSLTMENRYYSTAEYRHLTGEQRAELKAIREAEGTPEKPKENKKKRKQGPKKEKKREKKKQKKNPSEGGKDLSRRISAVEAKFDQLEKTTADVSSDSEESDAPPPKADVKGNAKHSALTRQRKK
jgi:hypothetical protein